MLCKYSEVLVIMKKNIFEKKQNDVKWRQMTTNGDKWRQSYSAGTRRPRVMGGPLYVCVCVCVCVYVKECVSIYIVIYNSMSESDKKSVSHSLTQSVRS